jgi:hypothetical protein
MDADELHHLKNGQINTPMSLECCDVALLECWNAAILQDKVTHLSTAIVGISFCIENANWTEIE